MAGETHEPGTSTGGAMRIAVVHWGRRELGGAEAYIGRLLPELRRLGHDVALWSELDEPSDREPMPLPEGTPEWCAQHLGREPALAALRAWRPDLLYVQIVTDPDVEAAVLEVAPAVLFAHGYFGTCISGNKMHQSPVPTPCARRFGPQCLVLYYPRRCGGLSPLTMLRDYRRNAGRRDLLPRYRAIVTNSGHMRQEYVRQGCDPQRVHDIPLPVPAFPGAIPERGVPRGDDPWRLLFTGRISHLKGGSMLLESLPRVVEALDRRLHVTFAGDGPDREEWEHLARVAQSRAPGRLSMDFVGWKSAEELEHFWRSADLLVVPSIWPEPFGLVGPEAGLRGVPAAAFAVGGISDWLVDGVNGYLAPGDPPTPAGLTEAIVRCLRDPDVYASLREGAVQMARRFDTDAHLGPLTQVLEAAARSSRSAR